MWYFYQAVFQSVLGGSLATIYFGGAGDLSSMPLYPQQINPTVSFSNLV